jgi:hypothetical protein
MEGRTIAFSGLVQCLVMRAFFWEADKLFDVGHRRVSFQMGLAKSGIGSPG